MPASAGAQAIVLGLPLRRHGPSPSWPSSRGPSRAARFALRASRPRCARARARRPPARPSAPGAARAAGAGPQTPRPRPSNRPGPGCALPPAAGPRTPTAGTSSRRTRRGTRPAPAAGVRLRCTGRGCHAAACARCYASLHALPCLDRSHASRGEQCRAHAHAGTERETEEQPAARRHLRRRLRPCSYPPSPVAQRPPTLSSGLGRLARFWFVQNWVRGSRFVVQVE